MKLKWNGTICFAFPPWNVLKVSNPRGILWGRKYLSHMFPWIDLLGRGIWTWVGLENSIFEMSFGKEMEGGWIYIFALVHPDLRIVFGEPCAFPSSSTTKQESSIYQSLLASGWPCFLKEFRNNSRMSRDMHNFAGWPNEWGVLGTGLAESEWVHNLADMDIREWV